MELAPDIKQALAEIYSINAKYTGQALTTAAEKAGVKASFSMPTTKQAMIVLEDAQPVMSKIAFNSLQDADALIHRLQNEMARAVILGESQDGLIKRIRSVMQDGQKRAKRIAQTEGTRVQSQARYNTIHEAAQMGINVQKRWSTRMVNSRESHIALNGKIVGADEKFKTITGYELAYPGDPSAPAAEVINCYCVLVPVVGKAAGNSLQNGNSYAKLEIGKSTQLTAGKASQKPSVLLQSNAQGNITASSKQIGHKAGKHMEEWGLNPASAEDRKAFIEITQRIIDNPQEIRRVKWDIDPKTKERTVEVNAYISGGDVVFVRDNGEYITTMKGGINNERVKKGRVKDER